MNFAPLAEILRDKADELHESDHEVSPKQRYDAAELMRVLARVLEGKEIHRAFGAPGDWGYGTPIGDALAKAYRGESEVAA